MPLFVTHLGLCDPADYPEITAARTASKRHRGEMNDVASALNNAAVEDVIRLLQRHIGLTNATLKEHNERFEHIDTALNEADRSEAIDQRCDTSSMKACAMSRSRVCP